MRWLLATMVMTVVAAAAVALLHAQGPPAVPAAPSGPLDPKVIEWDKGSNKIDVSKYPADIQAKYKVFANLCSKCHTLARPINSEFVTEDEWERYVKKMMRRGKGLIQPDDALQIYEFLVYDAKIRKKDLFEKRLAAAPPR